MRIVHIISEIPYPANHGGRVDCWRRAQALKALGHELFVVTWAYVKRRADINPDDEKALRTVADEVQVYNIDRTLAGLLSRARHIGSWPSYMSARVLGGRDYQRLLEQIALFAPDIVLLDGLHSFWLASKLSKSLLLPLIYRSHNVEFNYIDGQRGLAKTFRQKAGFWFASLGLKARELQAHRDSIVVLDISVDDIALWERLGFDNSLWLPPLMQAGYVAPPLAETSYDLAYVGNLLTPNNVDGVTWMLNEVWPLIVADRPEATLVIAGLNPGQSLIELCAAARNVTILPNVPDAFVVLAAAKALINPIWMSSGVNIKAIDMLTVGAPVISTPAGIAGLPEQIKPIFLIGTDARSFADQCLRVLSSPDSDRNWRSALAAEYFSSGRLNLVMDQVATRIADHEA